MQARYWLMVMETTHTPQGDGNLAPQRSKHFAARNNPHPARGRKPFVCVKLAVALEKQPTPRKGTETPGMHLTLMS